MCGIFGWSIKPKAPRQSLATIGGYLAILNDDRGGHSWGLSGDGTIRRGLGDMARAYPKIGQIMGRAAVLLAHTRYATTGACTTNNAHPFEVGDILGAHNGIVYNHDWLNAHYGRRCAVDSMHFFHHLAAGLPTADIEAYGAIEWLDREEPDAVNLAYFHGGELTIARTEMGVFWSSDQAHLATALGWAGIKYQEYDTEEETIYCAHHGDLFKLGPIEVGRRKATTPARRWNDARPDPWDPWEEEERIEREERELDADFRLAIERDS